MSVDPADIDPEAKAKELDALITNQERVNNEGAAHPEIEVPADDELDVHEYEPDVEVEPGDQATG